MLAARCQLKQLRQQTAIALLISRRAIHVTCSERATRRRRRRRAVASVRWDARMPPTGITAAAAAAALFMETGWGRESTLHVIINTSTSSLTNPSKCLLTHDFQNLKKKKKELYPNLHTCARASTDHTIHLQHNARTSATESAGKIQMMFVILIRSYFLSHTH